MVMYTHVPWLRALVRQAFDPEPCQSLLVLVVKFFLGWEPQNLLCLVVVKAHMIR